MKSKNDSKITISPSLKTKLADPKYRKKVIRALEEICEILGIDISDLKRKYK